MADKKPNHYIGAIDSAMYGMSIPYHVYADNPKEAAIAVAEEFAADHGMHMSDLDGDLAFVAPNSRVTEFLLEETPGLIAKKRKE